MSFDFVNYLLLPLHRLATYVRMKLHGALWMQLTTNNFIVAILKAFCRRSAKCVGGLLKMHLI